MKKNPVAKFSRQINTPKVFKDRKKSIKRGARKHKAQPYQIAA